MEHSLEHNSNRGIGVAFLTLSFVALLVLSASPAFAVRALNCTLDNCYGLNSLWSLNGMDFNDDFNSATPNTERWNVWDDYNGNNNQTFDGQVMKIVMAPGNVGWSSAGVRSWYKLRGDFDIQVDYKNLVRGTAADGGVILHVDDDNNDNFYVRRNIVGQTVDSISGVNDIYNVPNAGSVTITSGSLRLTRVGSQMCSYYSTTIGGSWIQVGCNTSVEWAQDVQPLVQFALQNPGGTNSVEFDNFRIIKGQIVPDNTNAIYNPSDTFTTTTTDIDRYDNVYGNAGFNGSALVLNMTPAGGWVAHGVQTKYRLVGDFDVQIDFKDFVAGAGVDGGVAFLLVGPGDDDAALIRRQFVNSNGYQFFEHRNGGAWNQVGSNIATTQTTGKLRLTRVDNNVTGWYWNGASWSKAQSYSSNEWRQPMNLRIELSGAAPADTKVVKYDNLLLNSGTTTLSTGNIGYTQGANYTTGKFGTALRFNGAGDYVNLGTFNPANPHNVTLAAWFNMTSLGVTNGYYTNYILAKGADAFANSYGLFVGSANSAFSNSAVCIMAATGSGYQPLCAPVGQLVQGRWHHAAGVFSGQNYYVYVDGVLKASGTFTGTISRGTQAFRIGNQDRASYEYNFKGQIDDPQVWNKALSASEITALYNLGNPLPNVTTFIAQTTNFSNVADIENVGNMTLATAATAVRWTGIVNASGKNFDQYVNMGPGFVSLDVAALGQSINTTAVVNLTGINCENFDLYYATGVYYSLASLKSSGTLVATQQNTGGNCQDATKCTNVRCANGVLSFTAQHFDGFGGDNGTDQDVPEFGTWALMIALGLTIGGFVAIRRK